MCKIIHLTNEKPRSEPEFGDVEAEGEPGGVVGVRVEDVLVPGLQELGQVEEEGAEEGGQQVGEDPHPGAVGHLQRAVQQRPAVSCLYHRYTIKYA